MGSIYRCALEFAGSYANDPNPDTLVRLKQTVDSVVDMLYQRVGITNEVPFSEFLFDVVPVADEPPEVQDTMLALTDASPRAEILGDGLLEDSDERALTPQELAQGLEHAQAYEDEQRQEIAAETVDAVMYPATEPEIAAEELPETEATLEVKPA